MSNPTYSCQHTPQNYKLLHNNKDYPKPQTDTYFWHIANFTEDMDKYKVILAFEKVMQIWQRALDQIEPIGQFLHLKSTKELSEADFIFSFGPTEHDFPTSSGKIIKCPFPFDGQQGVLAHAWSLNSNDPYGGQMHLDESENWSNMHGFVDGKFYTHLLTVVLHEMGHIFDLGHSEVKDSIMYPAYTGIKQKLHNDDILGLSEKMSPIKQNVYQKLYEEHNQDKILKKESFWKIFIKILKKFFILK